MPQNPKKKLIEVALPLEAISKEASHEKFVRRGHPSMLHIWWARRPLAAARAVIWASLVDDPSSHPELFPTEKEQEEERNRLFRILEELVKWESSSNEQVLEEAKAEIKRSMGDDLPPLLDPFAGGGAIPLEAQRLGLEAHAHDLNPVAVIINKAMIEIPARFAGLPAANPSAQMFASAEGKGAAGLAEDVRYYGEWIKNEAFKRIGKLYPKIKDDAGIERAVIAWIWARTVKCPNPACGVETPLASSFVLSKKKGHEAYIKPIVEGGRVRYETHTGIAALDSLKAARGQFRCVACGALMDGSYIKEEACAGRMGAHLMAIVAEGNNGRIYLSPSEEHIEAASVPKPSEYPDGALSNDKRAICTLAYGLAHISDLFTSRQLTMLTTLNGLIEEVQKQAEEDGLRQGMLDDGQPLREGGRGAKAYGEAIAVYLAFLVAKFTNSYSSICSWDSSLEKIRNTFSRQAIPMTWDYAEGNPFCNSTCCFDNIIEPIVNSLKELPASGAGYAEQFDAQADCSLRGMMISTDPPYYDNIGYADLSDYFYVWLRRPLKGIYPSLFSLLLTLKAEELVALPYRFEGSKPKAREFFESGMQEALRRIHGEARADIPVTIFYAYKQSDADSGGNASTGWETMLSSIIRAGFAITGTWPMRTELSIRLRGLESNALASSVVIVCRKRAADAGILPWRDFMKALKRELPPAVKKMETGSISPVDMAQSAIGPGIAVFSRYNAVMEPDGTPITIRAALQQINKELDDYFSGQDSYMDGDSRFCATLFLQNGFEPIKYGEAEVLAKAKSASIDRLRALKVLYAEKGEVRLYSREELPEPETVPVDRCGAWALCQLLIKALNSPHGGRQACAAIYNRAEENEALEDARSLAYRLYSAAEQKGWAAEAHACNILVVEWMDIVRTALEQKLSGQLEFK